jgi:hypothetical protein
VRYLSFVFLFLCACGVFVNITDAGRVGFYLLFDYFLTIKSRSFMKQKRLVRVEIETELYESELNDSKPLEFLPYNLSELEVRLVGRPELDNIAIDPADSDRFSRHEPPKKID